MIEPRKTLRIQSFIDAMPLLIMALFFLHTLLVLYAPWPQHVERLWFEWLGSTILREHRIPLALGHEGLLGAGTPWIAHEWLFALVLAYCAAHGYDAAVCLVFACIVTLPVLICYLRLRRSHTDSVALSIGLLFVSQTLIPQIQMRASFAGYAVFALVCAALASNDRRQYWIPCLIVILANVHAAVTLLAVMPMLTWLADIGLRRKWDTDSQRLGMVSILSVLASACSPFGFSVYSYAASFGNGSHRYIAEWTPILAQLDSGIAQTDLFLIAVCISLIYVWKGERAYRASELVPLCIGLALVLSSERFAPLFLIAAVPLAFRNGVRTPRMPLAILRSPLLLGMCVAAFPGVNLAHTVFHLMHDPGIVLAARPGIRLPPVWLESKRIGRSEKQRVFCSNFAYCNAYLWSGARVVLDGRADPFPLLAFETTKMLNRQTDGWQQALTQLQINVIVFDLPATKLEATIAHSRAWHRADASPDSITYVRNDFGSP